MKINISKTTVVIAAMTLTLAIECLHFYGFRIILI
jgi:hypothetical protein